MNQYHIQGDIIKLCEHFADRVISTNKDCYKRRKQSNLHKIREDILIGKIAEWAVYFIYLERNRTNITPPDMQIYSVEDKSFDSDLRYGLYNLHIKAQTSKSADQYGDSWIFQAKDPLFEYPSEYDIIIGCNVSADMFSTYHVEILLEKPFQSLIFGEARLSKFGGNKKAVYLKDNE